MDLLADVIQSNKSTCPPLALRAKEKQRSTAMARTTLTDFDEWLDGAVATDLVEDVYALYEAVDGETGFAQYKAERAANGQLFVSYGDDSPWLRLSTNEAKEGFLRRIGGRYVGEGCMDVGAWYVMQMGLASD
jgi:hypothetical protein